MALTTTCIGAYPKPAGLCVRDWFQIPDGQAGGGGAVTRAYNRIAADLEERPDLRAQLDQATRQAVADQVACGVDIPTDGEQRRENYIHYHCRRLRGFDFAALAPQAARGGAYHTELPTINGAIAATDSDFLARDYRAAQAGCERPIKMTAPGPLTIADTSADRFYGDARKLAFALAAALNIHLRALAAAGCRHIQIDEPVFMRKPAAALDYGIAALERCFADIPPRVTTIVHLCCGYPRCLDDADYPKADPQNYHQLAAALDQSAVKQISIEDAHRPGDLRLLEQFPASAVIFGVVAVAQSAVEPAEAIATRLREALRHIDRDRLIAAPDCGLGFLGRDLARTKLKNLCAAAKQV